MRYRQVHLDFHTSERISGIGKSFDKKQFQEALKKGHVDSITVFSKCHHGWAYHPSKANDMHPGLDFDLLAAQIEAAHEIGVKTPVYISAGFDEKTAVRHPEWLNQPKDYANYDFSVPMYHTLCMNTDYLDYLLKQVEEVCENYDADGIFLDIVAVRPCYCPNCLRSMFEKGYDPENEDDVLKLAEEVYENYYRKIEETVHKIRPELSIFHNGGHIRHGRRDLAHANTHLEIESLPTGGWGYDHFPISAAYAQTLGMDFLGMTGKFHTSWGEFGGYKHPNALRYEIALNAAFGARSSIGDQLAPDGKMDMHTYSIIGEAYADIEKKEKWLEGTEAVADIGIFSVEANKNMCGENQVGYELTLADTGVGRIMLEGKYLFQFVDGEADFSDYKVIVLPDSITADEKLTKKLNDFLAKGGKILASGKSGIDMENKKFLFDFGATYIDKNPYTPSYVRKVGEETDYIMYSEGQQIELAGGAEMAEAIKPYFNRTREHFCSHLHSPSSHEYSGSGMVEGKDGVYIAWDIFSDYATKGELIAKELVIMALDTLLGEGKTLETSLKSLGVAALRRNGSEHIAHLLYVTPTKRGTNIEVVEDIVPVYDVELSVKLDNVKRVYLVPQMTELPFKTENGRCSVTVDKIECHQMVVFK